MDPSKGSQSLAMEAFPLLLQVGAPEARQTPDPGRGWSLIIEPVTAANFALQILLLSRQASIHSVHCTSGQRDHQQIANTLELSSWEITQPNLNLGTFYDTELNSYKTLC